MVILSIHWGMEHYNEPSVPQLDLAQRLTEETGIDLVIGHHAHVVQPIQKVGGTWIAYSLGNQVARHSSPTGLTEEGAIGWFEFRETAEGWDVTARYRTTLVDIPPEVEPGEKLPKGAVENHRLVDVQSVLDGRPLPRAARPLPARGGPDPRLPLQPGCSRRRRPEVTVSGEVTSTTGPIHSSEHNFFSVYQSFE